jgi:hypothetical protein
MIQIPADLKACAVTVSISKDHPEESPKWTYHGQKIHDGVLSIPKHSSWIVFVLDDESAKNFAFLRPAGVENYPNWQVYSWSANSVVVLYHEKECDQTGTFILWVETIASPGHFYHGGPEVTNTGDGHTVP